jgi:hypothetical protein
MPEQPIASPLIAEEAQTQHCNPEPPTTWNTLLCNELWSGDARRHRELLLDVR